MVVQTANPPPPPGAHECIGFRGGVFYWSSHSITLIVLKCIILAILNVLFFFFLFPSLVCFDSCFLGWLISLFCIAIEFVGVHDTGWHLLIWLFGKPDKNGDLSFVSYSMQCISTVLSSFSIKIKWKKKHTHSIKLGKPALIGRLERLLEFFYVG